MVTADEVRRVSIGGGEGGLSASVISARRWTNSLQTSVSASSKTSALSRTFQVRENGVGGEGQGVKVRRKEALGGVVQDGQRK